MIDVETDDLPTDITSGSMDKWAAWDDPNGGDAIPADFVNTDNDNLQLVTKIEYDLLGRSFLRTDAGGAKHYTAYQTSGDIDRVIQFSYWDDVSDEPLLPIQVRESDELDRLSSTYTLAPDFALSLDSNDAPIGLDPNTTVSTSDAESLTKLVYDDNTGQLTETQRFHDTSGETEFTNYYSTRLLYDVEGRVGATIQGVESGVHQVNVTLFDVLGRSIEQRRNVVSTVPDDYADLSGSLPSGYAKTSTTVYDSGNEGDSHVTKTKSYYGTTDFIETNFHRTWRGHLRGTDRKNNTTAFGPYSVMDVDWQGRVIDQAQYTVAPGNWTTLVDDEDYVASTSSNRNNWTKTHYDVLGRVYRTERYPGTQATNHFEVNNYYDRNGRLVCTGDVFSAHTEYAYDGAGRQYQVRTVTDVEATEYLSGGAFNYRKPVPEPDLDDLTDGDDKLVEFTHSVFDDGGNVTEQHTFEMNHNDTSSVGLTFTGTADYVRRSVFMWYDDADRLTTTADYGAGGGATGVGSWKHNTLPAPSSAPTVSADDVLVTLYTYHDDTGRQETVEDPEDVVTKTFYDDLGRRTFVAENYDDFDPDTLSTIGGGTNDEEDRVTGWVYNGLGQTVKLTAYNASSSTADQETEYEFEDAYNASLVTKTIYPDGNSTSDNVQRTYNLDGSLATMTDQRGVVHTYSYNDRRQLEADQITTLNGVDGAVESITRKYDDMGRLTHLTSHGNSTADPDNTTDIENQVKLSYDARGKVSKSEQSHEGAVGAGTPEFDYTYDTTTQTARYNDGLRLKTVDYPLVAAGPTFPARATYYYGSSNSPNERLNRPLYHALYSGAFVTDDERFISHYQYNGTSRVAEVMFEKLGSGRVVEREMFGATATDYDAWDRFGRTLQHKWKKNSTVHDQVDYTYDFAGNRLSRDVYVDPLYADDRDQVYAYDGLHRLQNVEGGTLSSGSITSRQLEQDWTLDQLGNWSTFKQRDTDTGSTWDLDQDRAHNDVNELTSFTTTTGTDWADPAYDAAGNAILIPQFIDKVEHFELIYDAWNRLVKVMNHDNDKEVQRNEYDGFNRRIVRKEYSLVSGTLNETRHFYYNRDWQVLVEAVEDTSSEVADAMYSYHPHYVDAVAVRIRDDDAHFYLHDANYNVTAMADDTGTVVERYSYTPYGETTFMSEAFVPHTNPESGIDNEYLYTGRRLDPETHLQLNRNRFYIPPLGRWLTRDPIGYEGSQWNLYEYVNSMPTVSFDPSGKLVTVPPPVVAPAPIIGGGGAAGGLAVNPVCIVVVTTAVQYECGQRITRPIVYKYYCDKYDNRDCKNCRCQDSAGDWYKYSRKDTKTVEGCRAFCIDRLGPNYRRYSCD